MPMPSTPARTAARSWRSSAAAQASSAAVAIARQPARQNRSSGRLRRWGACHCNQSTVPEKASTGPARAAAGSHDGAPDRRATLAAASNAALVASHSFSAHGGTAAVPWNIGTVVAPTVPSRSSIQPPMPKLAWPSASRSSGSTMCPPSTAAASIPSSTVPVSIARARPMPARNRRWLPARSSTGTVGTAIPSNAAASSTEAGASSPGKRYRPATSNTRPALRQACSHGARLAPGIGVAAATGRNCSRLPSIALPSTPRVNTCTSAAAGGAQRPSSTSGSSSSITPASTPHSGEVSRKRNGRVAGGAPASARALMPLVGRRAGRRRPRAGRW